MVEQRSDESFIDYYGRLRDNYVIAPKAETRFTIACTAAIGGFTAVAAGVILMFGEPATPQNAPEAHKAPGVPAPHIVKQP